MDKESQRIRILNVQDLLLQLMVRTFPAPFVIEAIGDMDVLHASLYLKGGVIDRLIRDNIVVTTEQVERNSFISIEERKLKCRREDG